MPKLLEKPFDVNSRQTFERVEAQGRILAMHNEQSIDGTSPHFPGLRR